MSMLKRAKLIVIEGIDGVGKSTQAELMRRYFAEERGLKTRLFKLPFNDKVTHRIIYGMLFNGLARKHPSLFQFVQFVNKLVFQLFVLAWSLFTNDVIILDRWVMSAQVYGDADGAHPFITRTMNRALTRADATILMLGPKHKRSRKQDTYEVDDAYQKRVLELYRTYIGFANVRAQVGAKNDRSTVADVTTLLLLLLWQHESLSDDQVRDWAKLVYGDVPQFVDAYVAGRKPAVIPLAALNPKLVAMATADADYVEVDGVSPLDEPPTPTYTGDLEDVAILLPFRDGQDARETVINKKLIAMALTDETPGALKARLDAVNRQLEKDGYVKTRTSPSDDRDYKA